jgi:hypothetical protein
MMDGVKICYPLRADRHFTKHGVIYEAPPEIFCNSLLRGPQCFLSTFVDHIIAMFDDDPDIYDYGLKHGVMKVHINKAARRIEHQAVWQDEQIRERVKILLPAGEHIYQLINHIDNVRGFFQ